MDQQPKEIPAVYAAEKVAGNIRIVYTVRVMLSIMSGSVCGVLGLTGLVGFLFYFVVSVAAGLGLWVKTQGKAADYFIKPSYIFTEGVSQGVASFVLFWTLMFDIVHLF